MLYALCAFSIAEAMRHVIRQVCTKAFFLVQKFYPRSPDLGLHLRALVVITLFFGVAAVLFVAAIADIAGVYALKDYRPPTPSKLLDRKGRLITTFFQDQRILVSKEEIPLFVKQAFLAMEDNHFYSHWGIDPQGILRAALTNLWAGGVKQGGSTITQQLAKVILTGKQRTLTRKAKEAILALLIDAKYSKDDILQLYFNQIYFGHGTYGIEAAAQFYFQKKTADLTLGEAAILATLPSAPNYYSPVRNPRISMTKLSLALRRMVDRGFISIPQAEAAYREMLHYYAGLNISPSETAYGRRQDEAPYYSETVRQILEKEIGKTLLYEGGLVIHGTLDLDHQNAAQWALWRGLRQQNAISRDYIFGRFYELSAAHAPELEAISLLFDLPPFVKEKRLSQYEIELEFFDDYFDSLELLNLAMGGEILLDTFLSSIRANNPYINRNISVQGALVEIDNLNGQVTAIVGGLPFSAQNQINRAMQIRRQPGSTFKPLLYAAGIDLKAVTAATILPDTPVVFLDERGIEWMPENYSGGYKGFISMREALAASANMVSIALAREIGLSNAMPKLAKIIGVKQEQIPYNLSVALGTYEMSPLQLARSFALFPRGGKAIEPYVISKITDADGTLLRDLTPQANNNPEQVLNLGTATIMTSLLADAVNKGTGRSVRNAGYSGFVAGKTGTTNNFRDAWFVGYNRRYTTAVWVGYDRASLSLGAGQAGAGVAAPIWSYYNQRIAPLVQKDEPYLAEGGTVEVVICRTTGKLPYPGCPEVERELFLPGTEPKDSGDIPTGAGEVPALPTRQNKIDEEDFFADDDR